jgi:hypothetical protein
MEYWNVGMMGSERCNLFVDTPRKSEIKIEINSVFLNSIFHYSPIPSFQWTSEGKPRLLWLKPKPGPLDQDSLRCWLDWSKKKKIIDPCWIIQIETGRYGTNKMKPAVNGAGTFVLATGHGFI